jgi:ABC-type nitrate/sulfonate/bicarbonate transport system permease component
VKTACLRVGLVDRADFPPRSSIIAAVVGAMRDVGFWSALDDTIQRVPIGLLTASAAGATLGSLVDNRPDSS